MTPKEKQEKITEVLNNPNLLKALKREFDRSFFISVTDNGGGFNISFKEKDTGLPVMTIGDVAAFLQTDRASVRRMTGERAQHRSHHPIPFVKIGNRMLRFDRSKVEAWWKELNASENGRNNTSALTLPKGRSRNVR